jgi:hypothetical protein
VDVPDYGHAAPFLQLHARGFCGDDGGAHGYTVLWMKANANFELQTAGATAHVLAIRLLQ